MVGFASVVGAAVKAQRIEQAFEEGKIEGKRGDFLNYKECLVVSVAAGILNALSGEYFPDREHGSEPIFSFVLAFGIVLTGCLSVKIACCAKNCFLGCCKAKES